MPTFIFNTGKGRKQINVPRWALVLAGFVAAGLGVLLLLLAASLALIIVPVTILGVVFAGWLSRRKGGGQGASNGDKAFGGKDFGGKRGHRNMQDKTTRPNQTGVIEAEYSVIEKNPDKNPK